MEHQWKKKLASRSRLYVGDLIIIVKIHGTTPQYVEKLTNDISRFQLRQVLKFKSKSSASDEAWRVTTGCDEARKLPSTLFTLIAL